MWTSVRPCRVAAVQMMAMMGAFFGIPLAGSACDMFGFPLILMFGALLHPLCIEGYALAGMSRITWQLFVLRALHGLSTASSEARPSYSDGQHLHFLSS